MHNLEKRIVINSKILSGKPIVRGTRVPVYVILGSLAAGMEDKEVMKEYKITHDDIHACLTYATDVVSSEEAYSFLNK
jgi:uncharacterized protein (DUF433 family)